MAHVSDITISLTLVRSRLEEDGFGKLCRDAILQKSHVKAAALETVSHHEEVHAIIHRLRLEFNNMFTDAAHWINFCCKLAVLFELEAIGDLGKSLVLDIALFEDKRCVLLHTLSALVTFTILGLIDLDLFDWHQLLALKL